MKINSAALNGMGVREFGDALITTRDLDPLYVGLVNAKLPEPQLCRYLLAYWCFYHVGAAAWLSEAEDSLFWTAMTRAALNATSPRGYGLPSDRWPRSAERRHFRGQKCVDAVTWFSRNPPEGYARSLSTHTTDKGVMAEASAWPMFGPWIAFKCADMMERVYGSQVSFNPDLGLMYEQPRAVLDILVRGYSPPDGTAWTERDWYTSLLTYFSGHPAPPVRDGNGTLRRCGPQEVETVLCKWKSYRGGHYYVGKDIDEHREALAGWGATAHKLLAAYPQRVGAQAHA